jgi:hypothetical protein
MDESSARPINRARLDSNTHEKIMGALQVGQQTPSTPAFVPSEPNISEVIEDVSTGQRGHKRARVEEEEEEEGVVQEVNAATTRGNGNDERPARRRKLGGDSWVPGSDGNVGAKATPISSANKGVKGNPVSDTNKGANATPEQRQDGSQNRPTDQVHKETQPIDLTKKKFAGIGEYYTGMPQENFPLTKAVLKDEMGAKATPNPHVESTS